MRKLFQILEKLTEQKIHYCLMSHSANNYFNLAVTDPQGERRYINAEKMTNIEVQLDIMWGHIAPLPPLVITTPLPLPPVNILPGMPLPPRLT